MSIGTLADLFGRRMDYLRVSVTEQCHFHCLYCTPMKLLRNPALENTLPPEDTERLVRIFAQLGIRKVRLTGGEPLIRREIVEIASRLAAIPGIEDLSITTNGDLLPKLAGPLKAAGVQRINISIDSLRPDRFTAVTRGGKLERVLDGLRAARQAGLRPIKVNCVVMRGHNDDELGDFLEFGAANSVDVRFLELMPTAAGLSDRNTFVSTDEMIEALRAKGYVLHPLHPGGTIALEYGVGPLRTTVGFIASVSKKFCATCSRLRLLANGTLKLCLHGPGSLDLRALLQAGASDEEVAGAIRAAVLRKPWGSEFTEKIFTPSVTNMMAVGG